MNRADDVARQRATNLRRGSGGLEAERHKGASPTSVQKACSDKPGASVPGGVLLQYRVVSSAGELKDYRLGTLEVASAPSSPGRVLVVRPDSAAAGLRGQGLGWRSLAASTAGRAQFGHSGKSSRGSEPLGDCLRWCSNVHYTAGSRLWESLSACAVW